MDKTSKNVFALPGPVCPRGGGTGWVGDGREGGTHPFIGAAAKAVMPNVPMMSNLGFDHRMLWAMAQDC